MNINTSEPTPTDVMNLLLLSNHPYLSSEKIISLLRTGMPIESVGNLLHVCRGIELSTLLSLMDISKRTYTLKLKEQKRLTRAQSNVLYRVSRIILMATGVFESIELAEDWLQTSARYCGEAPITMLDTYAGTEQVVNLLSKIEHSVYS